MKSLSSDSDVENDDTLPHKRDSGQHKKVRNSSKLILMLLDYFIRSLEGWLNMQSLHYIFVQRLRVRFGGGDDDDDIPERTPSPIVLPVDASTSTDQLEYDK